MIGHPSDREFQALRDGTLAADDVLAVDAHLSGCGECRARAAAFAGAGADAMARGLAIEPDAEMHPDDEQLAAFADGSSAATADVARHIADCPDCAATVEDLTLLRAAIDAQPNPSIARWAMAVAAIAVVAVSLLMWNKPRPSGPERFSAVEQATIAAAFDSGTLPPARNLDSVRTPAGRLMGSPSSGPSFAPLSPLATAIDSPQPVFRWTPLEGAREYVVTVVDETLRPVAQSTAVTVTEWRPAGAFARGRTYIWQVRAMLANGSRTAPAPPEPEARFFVVSEAESAAIASVRQRAGDTPQAAILLAQHGLLEDAEAELAKAAAQDPSNAALQKLAAAAAQARTAPTDRR